MIDNSKSSMLYWWPRVKDLDVPMPWAWGFTAFRGLPIGMERRYFVKDGQVLCHHPYWPEDAIRNPSVDNWQDILKDLNTEGEEEIKLLTSYAEKISRAIEGYWSVDFCKDKSNSWWWLIDMAEAKESWHPQCDRR